GDARVLEDDVGALVAAEDGHRAHERVALAVDLEPREVLDAGAAGRGGRGRRGCRLGRRGFPGRVLGRLVLGLVVVPPLVVVVGVGGALLGDGRGVLVVVLALLLDVVLLVVTDGRARGGGILDA